MGAGATLATGISGSLDAKNIVLGVLKKQVELSNLADICAKVDVPELNATIPVMTAQDAGTDLGEFEDLPGGVEGAAFSYVSFDLKKDRIKLAVSDEARFRSRAGDPLALQIDANAMVLANKLDTKIATALITTPQTGVTTGAWSTVTNNPLKDFAKACAAILPYKADYCIMPKNVWVQFAGNDYTAKFAEGAPENMKNVLGYIPGLGLKVYVNDTITAKACLVGCSGAPSCALGQGPVEVFKRKIEGGEMYTIDVWRQAKSTLLKNASNLNMGAYLLTAVIA